MKVALLGLGLAPGKYKYSDDCFRRLQEKYKPKKTSPYFLEFTDANPAAADVIAYAPEKKVDLIINDLDIIEKRLLKTESEREKEVLRKFQMRLENNQLISEADADPEELDLVKNLNLLSLRPCVAVDKQAQEEEVVSYVFAHSGFILFYTAGPKEVHAWPLRQGGSVLQAAGRIHSDLARGFIKAEVVSCRELVSVFNWAEAKAKGMVKSVGRDYVVEPGDVIEIKFSV